MQTLSKALLALCLFWNVGVFARQPTPFLPDPELTPGAVFDVTIEDICTPGYSKKVRAVPKALRNQAYGIYGIASYHPGDYQLDHLIPLSIGGSNSIRNLWPQPNNALPWDARAKDRLERRLLQLVCAGEVALATAQRDIALDRGLPEIRRQSADRGCAGAFASAQCRRKRGLGQYSLWQILEAWITVFR